MTRIDTQVQTIQSIYAAFGRGAIGEILERVTSDAEFSFAGAAREVPWHGPWHGSAQLERFFETIGSAVEFEAFEPLAFAASSEHVAVRLHLRYKVRHTGKVVEQHQVHWWTLRDGRVSALVHFEDTAQVIAAVRA